MSSPISPGMVDGRQWLSKCLFPLRTRRHCSVYWMEGIVSCKEKSSWHTLSFTLPLSSWPEGWQSRFLHKVTMRGNCKECTVGPKFRFWSKWLGRKKITRGQHMRPYIDVHTWWYNIYSRVQCKLPHMCPIETLHTWEFKLQCSHLWLWGWQSKVEEAWAVYRHFWPSYLYIYKERKKQLLKPESIKYILQAKSGPPHVFRNKVYWNTAALICLDVVCGCSCAPVGEPTCCDRDNRPLKA